MREEEFPFAKYRDWGEQPSIYPEIDTQDLLHLSDWHQRIFRRPILDDITGSYQFFPSHNGFETYVKVAIKRNPAKPIAGEPVEEYLARVKRQPINIAKQAELATALFWTAAEIRREVLLETISAINDDKEIRTDIINYAADAIADYGYCLENPVDKDHTGKDRGNNLKAQIDRIAPGLGDSLLKFGLFSESHPIALHSFEGVAAIETTIAEQERRIKHWQPRHESVVSVYPKIEISEEILMQHVPLDEMLDIQTRILESV